MFSSGNKTLSEQLQIFLSTANPSCLILPMLSVYNRHYSREHNTIYVLNQVTKAYYHITDLTVSTDKHNFAHFRS